MISGPGILYNRGNAFRNAGILHRSAITAVDKLLPPVSATVADVATGGSLNFSTTYNMTFAAGNQWGPTTVPAVGAVTTAADASATHVARCTLTQVTNADYYDLFLSTAANPLWVARITEAQRAAGVTVTAVGTVSATSPGAGIVDIRVVGTGVASNSTQYLNNNAFTPQLITPISCAGYSTAFVMVKITVPDLRLGTPIAFLSFVQNQLSTGDWFPSTAINAQYLNSARDPLLSLTGIGVSGVMGLVILCDAFGGQSGTQADIWVDLV